MKYRNLLMALPEDQLYSAATIATFAEEKRLVNLQPPGPKALGRQRIRIALARFAANQGFPATGDGLITLRGQAPTAAWYGWRWHAAVLS